MKDPFTEAMMLKEVVIEPSQTVMALLDLQRQHLPPINIREFVSNSLRHRIPTTMSFGFNMRSCLAKTGLTTGSPVLPASEMQMMASLVLGTPYGQGEEANILMKLINYGDTTLRLRIGLEICRPVVYNLNDFISESELRALVADGAITGEEGTDWGYVVSEWGTSCVWLAIDKTRHFRIKEDDEPLEITSRLDLYRHQTEHSGLPRSGSRSFTVTQTTSRVNVPEGLIGKLAAYTMYSRGGGFYTNESIHLPALVLDPGTSFSPRVEILGRNENSSFPDAVFLAFSRAADGKRIDPETYPY